MFPVNLAVALAFILTPDEVEEGAIPPVPLWAFREAALSLELLDARECRYTFAVEADFASDLGMIRRRAVELADAPPLLDADRWPSRDLVSEVCAANWAYRTWLDDRRLLFPRETWIDDAYHEAEELYEVWDLVRDAKSDYYYLTVRRKALRDLRERLGPEAYYSGCLPPPVPVWRFRLID